MIRHDQPYTAQPDEEEEVKTYMGIDPSLTGTGVVVLNEEGRLLEAHTFSALLPKKKKGEKWSAAVIRGFLLGRCLGLLQEIVNVVLRVQPALVVQEDLVSFGSNMRGAKDLAYLSGLIEDRLDGCQVKLQLVTPTDLKKFVTQKAKVDKSAMRLRTFQRWGVEFEDDNQTDAYGLARYGLETGRRLGG